MFISKRHFAEMERRISNLEKEVFCQKGKDSSGIDTSIDGFEYAGIKLSESQFNDLVFLNMQFLGKRTIPVFNILILLKLIGILPKEMAIESQTNRNSHTSTFKESEEEYYRKYGRRMES